MADQKFYRGVAPLTGVLTDGGAKQVHVYQGAPVPAGADLDDVARLVKEGYLVETDAFGVPIKVDEAPKPAAAAQPQIRRNQQ